MNNKNHFIIVAMILLLAGANLGRWILGRQPVIDNEALSIPSTLNRQWHGSDVPHSKDELAILGPVSLLKRTYTNSENSPPVWLIVHQTPAVGQLHNVYVSLIASGSKPVVLGTHTLQTRQGNLSVSKIKLQGPQQDPRTGYLWYQWRDAGGNLHNSPTRWGWYAAVLKQRLPGYIPQWRLTEIITPEDTSSEARLEAFAKLVYELPENSRN